MRVNNLSKVALDSAAAGIEPAIPSRKSNTPNHYVNEPNNNILRPETHSCFRSAFIVSCYTCCSKIPMHVFLLFEFSVFVLKHYLLLHFQSLRSYYATVRVFF